MIRSAIKVIGQAAVLHAVGGLVSLLLISALGGFERPLAFHTGRIVAAAIWYSCTIWVYRREGLGSIWSWEGASASSRLTVALAMAAGLIGTITAGKIEQYGIQNLKNVFDPAKSIAFTICVTVPIMEEVFWRGFLLRRLSMAIGFWPSLAVSSIAFGLGHSNPLPAMALGAFYGWLYSPTGSGSLLISILCHALHNLTSKLTF